MNTKLTALTPSDVHLTAVASAHPGATGVVRERMDGMMTMQTSVRALVPTMQGSTDYDPQSVMVAAAIMQRHAGETMTALFPEGNDQISSAASPAVWEDWDEFERLAKRPEVVARALQVAADNPPEIVHVGCRRTSRLRRDDGRSKFRDGSPC